MWDRVVLLSPRKIGQVRAVRPHVGDVPGFIELQGKVYRLLGVNFSVSGRLCKQEAVNGAGGAVAASFCSCISFERCKRLARQAVDTEPTTSRPVTKASAAFRLLLIEVRSWERT